MCVGRSARNREWTEHVIVEHVWSRADATSGNREQTHGPRRRLDYLRSSANTCLHLPKMLHGKEGVDGSSPSEGFGGSCCGDRRRSLILFLQQPES
jgi:hypothetical protein